MSTGEVYGELIAQIVKLNGQVDRLKCCGNCRNWDGRVCDYGRDEIMLCFGANTCHWDKLRWQEKRP